MPGDGISHEAYPHDRGEQGFTAQKQSAFPALAVLKSLVHEELGRKEKKDQADNKENVPRGYGEYGPGHERRKGDHSSHETEIEIDDYRPVCFPEFFNEADSHPREHACKETNDLTKKVSPGTEIEEDPHTNQGPNDAGYLQE